MISETDWSSPIELDSVAKPRPVRLSKAGKAAIAGLGLAFVITTSAFLFLFSMQRPRQQELKALQRGGVASTGIVASKSYVGGKGAHYQVFYSYQVGAVSYRRMGWLDRQTYNSAFVGQSIPITYLPSAPQVAKLSTERENGGWLINLIMPVFLLLPIGLIWRQIKKQKLLVQSGDPARAVIEKIVRVKKGYSVSYRFSDEAGQSILGTALMPRNRTPKVGEIVTAIYLTPQPSQNTLYPAPMVDLIAVSPF
jgi:hypothetical protein